jgi:quercetin dioxygenase-like cupin family protein
VTLAAGDLLLIAAGEGHEIRAADDAALVTVNVYAPPVY